MVYDRVRSPVGGRGRILTIGNSRTGIGSGSSGILSPDPHPPRDPDPLLSDFSQKKGLLLSLGAEWSRHYSIKREDLPRISLSRGIGVKVR